jgi:hypothetical protein
MKVAFSVLLLLMLQTASCSSGTVESGVAASENGLAAGGDVRMNQLQTKGTHNSYHKARWIFAGSLDYSFEPLGVQLAEQGVRSFELDLHHKHGRFEVHHAWNDPRSTCERLVDCLRAIKTWSDAHRSHPPMPIMLEPKQDIDDVDPKDYYADLEAEILSVWPLDRLVTPDLVKGDAPTLRQAVTERGWPRLEDVRGRVFFFLSGPSEHRAFYTHGDHDLDGRLAFVSASLDAPYAAVAVMDEPKEKEAAITAAVRAGFFIRTRADSGLEEAKNGDRSRLEAALRSGAQIVSTDFPAPTGDTDYVVTIPGGTPWRCNPVLDVPSCSPLE